MLNNYFKKVSDKAARVARVALLSLLMAPVLVSAQDQTVSGTVKDADGFPLAGVTVIVQGTTVGVATNKDGKYSIKVPAKSEVLQFSLISYEDQNIAVGKRSTIDVTMVESAVAIEEIVAIGYGTGRRADQAGSVASITGVALTQSAATNVAEQMIGKIAGVQVTPTENGPGADIIIRVRGGGSITQDNSPLYIIDGFPSEIGLSAINPNDIQSIDILKDAASTAIYGSRGANGVVLVTTKSGKMGKTTVNYNGAMTWKWLPTFMDVMTPYDFVIAQWDMYKGWEEGSSIPKNYGSWESLYPTWYGKKGIDWQKEVLGATATTQTHNLSITAGTKESKLNASMSHVNEKGILINTALEKMTMKLKFDQNLSKKAKASFAATYSNRKNSGGKTYGGKLANAVMYRPTSGADKTDEELLLTDYDPENYDLADLMFNPIREQETTVKIDRYQDAAFTGKIDYQFTKSFSMTGSAGYSFGDTRKIEEGKSGSADVKKSGHNGAGVTTEQYNNIDANLVANYNTRIGNNHNLSLMAGTEIRMSTERGLSMDAASFEIEDYMSDNMGWASQLMGMSSDMEENRLASFFGRAMYNYKERYLLNATLRADGSSKFSPQNRWGYFPSVSAAWRISEEPFMKDVTWVNALKLRGSYGQAGNDRIATGQFVDTYTLTTYGLNGTLAKGLKSDHYTNADLKWETTISQNIGFDVALFRSRVEVTADFYLNRTKDLLLNANKPSTTGFTKRYENVGSTQNKGMEFTVNTRNILTKNFHWTTDFNISFNKSKITALTQGENSYLVSSEWFKGITNDYLVEVGRPVGIIVGYEVHPEGWYRPEYFYYTGSAGSFALRPQYVYNAISNNYSHNPNIVAQAVQAGESGMGYMRYVDTNRDGVINTDDRVPIGNTNPKFFGGINNTFRYGSFELSAFFNFVYGNDILNGNRYRFTSAERQNVNMLSELKDRFFLIDGNGQRFTSLEDAMYFNRNAKRGRPNTNTEFFNSSSVEDGSFLRLNTLTLTYSLNPRICKMLYLQQVKINLTGSNLWTWTNYSGFDPEVSKQAGKNPQLCPGIDYSAYPKARSWSIRLDVTF